MDRHEVAVVIEDHDLQEPAGSVGSDVEITVALVEYADGVADRVLDVEIIDSVLAGVVSDLHVRRLPCLRRIAQVTLRRWGVVPESHLPAAHGVTRWPVEGVRVG